MNVAIIGTGYVGLVSGVCLASKGHQVTCYDRNNSVIKKLNSGIPSIYERGLSKLLKEVIKKKNFSVTSSLIKAISQASIIIVAVGTPSKGDGSINLGNVIKVSKKIGNFISGTNKFVTVVIKSTVVPGTTDTLIKKVIEKSSGKKLGKFGLGMNPEFLREGNAIEDFMSPDRIVLGHENSKTLKILEELYSPWKIDKIRVNSRTAELIKYANNAILATQISTINEISNLAFSIGKTNIKEVIKGVHLDKRWSPIIKKTRINPEILKYLVPGYGFGGSCFSKDLNAIVSLGKNVKTPMKVLESVLKVNKYQPNIVNKILKKELKNLKNEKILILGLSFKPGTDDVRDSPSLKIVKNLIKKKANVFAHDPKAVEKFKNALGKQKSKVKFVKKWDTMINKVKTIVLVTSWKEYLKLTNYNIKNKLIIDARLVLKKKYFKNSHYISFNKE